MKTRVLFLVVSGLICACQSSTSNEARQSPEQWQVSTPDAEGMDPAPLQALDREFRDGVHGYIDAMLVIRHGKIVFEQSYQRDYDTPYQSREHFPGPYNYYNPEWHPYYRRGSLHTLQSVTKSVTSAVFGVASSRGELPDLKTPILPFFKDYKIENVDERKKRITLEDLLTMTAGFDWDETIPYDDPSNPAVAMEASDDWIQFVLNRPMAHEPGTFFSYSSGVSQLLSVIFRESTGRLIDAYAREYLFGPIGIENFYWKRTPQGHVDTEGGLFLSARDLSRIGILFLNQGRWGDKQILDRSWVKASVSPHVPQARPGFAYGYQWWLAPYEANGKPTYAYVCLGYGGQRLLVLPEYDLVAVFLGWNLYGKPPLDAHLAMKTLLQALP